MSRFGPRRGTRPGRVRAQDKPLPRSGGDTLLGVAESGFDARASAHLTGRTSRSTRRRPTFQRAARADRARARARQAARLLLLDEPVANLDPLARREFMQVLLEEVAETGMSVVLSSHLIEDLERACDYFVLMSRSRVQLSATTDDLLAGHQVLTGPRSHAKRSVRPTPSCRPATPTGRRTCSSAPGAGDPPGFTARPATLGELALRLYEPAATPGAAATLRPVGSVRRPHSDRTRPGGSIAPSCDRRRAADRAQRLSAVHDASDDLLHGQHRLSACLAGHDSCDIQAEAFLTRFGSASHVFSAARPGAVAGLFWQRR